MGLNTLGSTLRAQSPDSVLCPFADEVEVSGVVIRQFGPMIPGMRCQVSTAPAWPCQRLCDAGHPHHTAAKQWGAHCHASAGRLGSKARRHLGPQLVCLAALQVGLALQATDLSVASERKAEVEVTLEAAQTFAQFWRAHAGCPLLGRNKVRVACRCRPPRAPGVLCLRTCR